MCGGEERAHKKRGACKDKAEKIGAKLIVAFRCLAGVVLLLTSEGVRGGVEENPASPNNPRERGAFLDQEWQLDIFGAGNFYRGTGGNFASAVSRSMGGSDLGEQRQLSGRPGWGGGIGVNYFWSRYFGVGVEQGFLARGRGDTTPQEADYYYQRWQTSGYGILRYPIERWSLAPYMLAGGGGQYGNKPEVQIPHGGSYKMRGLGFGQIGGGMEYRLASRIGLYSDLRWLFSEIDGLPNNQMQWRYGIRVTF
jgi:hypothetical protein